ncbi:hypothetical protein NDK47_21120 [Brevibacillus ruminantium]|uniref:Uncharacterized protein n=1 Tax=Brevibacillus ruminantium TaxID=2950604 RepID=A0ABY4WBS1_9BACL|nr:hypothetical protein [Brevibacillus ruminantium]USG64620.1 hypothetical protein NDK47_21120 [Brevibacillus ruminantium]
MTEHEKFLWEELSMANDSNLRMAYLLEDYIDFISETGLQEAFKVFREQKAIKQTETSN